MSEKPHPEAVAVAMELFPVTPLEFDRDNGRYAIAEQEEAAKLISVAIESAIAEQTKALATAEAELLEWRSSGLFAIKAADAMADVCDDWVNRNLIDARSALADARLNSCEPTSTLFEKFRSLSDGHGTTSALDVYTAQAVQKATDQASRSPDGASSAIVG